MRRRKEERVIRMGWMDGLIDDGLMIDSFWIRLMDNCLPIYLFPLYYYFLFVYLSICLYVHLDVLVLIRKYQG